MDAAAQHDDTETATPKGNERQVAIMALAKAIWRINLDKNLSDAEVEQDWRTNEEHFVAVGAQLLNQLYRRGFIVAKKHKYQKISKGDKPSMFRRLMGGA